MKPVYLDLHIHTSENPNSLDVNYPLEVLLSGIEKSAAGSPYMISITDHNIINKSVYLRAASIMQNIILGVELHVRNYESKDPYHCHAYFDIPEISEEVIDDLNSRLDRLYPNKLVSSGDDNIPMLEHIMKELDNYEYLLLPHGGQSHSEFHKSVSGKFDNVMERNIYYNHFDGFTARSNSGLEKTQEYFKKLGINEFVNLITSTDNYSPHQYPNSKAKGKADPFIPTWMLAKPTFQGLRLSLSESSRLVYGEKPDEWMQFIKKASLSMDNIDIDADLTPGLNVVIGGSSSGKTLFVDSIFRKASGTISASDYMKSPYNVSEIAIDNPTGVIPHYFYQNYIMKVCDSKDKENSINDIAILRSVFPSDEDEVAQIANGIASITKIISNLVASVRAIQDTQMALTKIPALSHLIVSKAIHANPLRMILPGDGEIEPIKLLKANKDRFVASIDEIDKFLKGNPLIEHDATLATSLKAEIEAAFSNSVFEAKIRKIIDDERVSIDTSMRAVDQEITKKRIDFDSLLTNIKAYAKAYLQFRNSLIEISKFSIKIETKRVSSMGHTLYIENQFELSKAKFLEVINGLLKREYEVRQFEDIVPESLFLEKFKKRDPVVRDYSDFEQKVKNSFTEMNKKRYKIITSDGRNFETLSAGWKTSIILDLILGWEKDAAPLIIDQPEDNLATGFINNGLITAIKKCKKNKQIILVSHNATIPMLGDAQNVIVCNNNSGKIEITSNPLEGEISGEKVVDLIAKITDGGKSSIKKRVKKYNLKSFRGENEDKVQQA